MGDDGDQNKTCGGMDTEGKITTPAQGAAKVRVAAAYVAFTHVQPFSVSALPAQHTVLKYGH